MTIEKFNTLETQKTPFIEILNRLYVESVKDKKDAELRAFWASRFGKYLDSVHRYVDELDQNIEDIRMISQLIKNENPGTEKLSRTNTSSSKLIRYHYENFFLRIGKFRDLFLLLINQVMELEINKDPHIEKKILKKVLPSNPNFEIIWRYVTDQMDELRPYRNHLAHNGTLKHEDLTMLDFYYNHEITHKSNMEKFRYELAMCEIQRDLTEKVTAIIDSYLKNVDLLQKMIYLFLGKPLIDKLQDLSERKGTSVNKTS